jgi:hypothetical protein
MTGAPSLTTHLDPKTGSNHPPTGKKQSRKQREETKPHTTTACTPQ